MKCWLTSSCAGAWVCTLQEGKARSFNVNQSDLTQKLTGHRSTVGWWQRGFLPSRHLVTCVCRAGNLQGEQEVRFWSMSKSRVCWDLSCFWRLPVILSLLITCCKWDNNPIWHLIKPIGTWSLLVLSGKLFLLQINMSSHFLYRTLVLVP